MLCKGLRVFCESEVVTNSHPDFSEFGLEDGALIPRGQNVAFEKTDFPWDIDVEKVNFAVGADQ